MGKRRKSAKKVTSKKKVSVSKTFKCPYCSHEASCEVKMDRGTETGTISCRVCGEDYQCRISFLDDPVDVYCQWIDACEAARTAPAGGAGGSGGGGLWE